MVRVRRPSCSSSRSRRVSILGEAAGMSRCSSENRLGPSMSWWSTTSVHFAPTRDRARSTAQSSGVGGARSSAGGLAIVTTVTILTFGEGLSFRKSMYLDAALLLLRIAIGGVVISHGLLQLGFVWTGGSAARS